MSSEIAAAPDGTEIPYFVVHGASAGKSVLLIAGVHGDEYEGVAALQDLAGSLRDDEVSGRITIVPVANPASFVAGTRLYPADNGDLNRSFPGNAQGRPAERLAQFLFDTFVNGQDAILSMHGWGREANVTPYVEFPIGDSAAAKSSQASALNLSLPFAHPYDWDGGLLVRAAVDHGIAAVETEVGGFGTTSAAGQEVSKQIISRFLAHCGCIEPANNVESLPVQIIEHQNVFAKASGLMRLKVGLNDTIVAGQKMGVICSLDGSIVQKIQPECDGLIGVLRGLASVRPGDLIAQVFYPLS